MKFITGNNKKRKWWIDNNSIPIIKRRIKENIQELIGFTFIYSPGLLYIYYKRHPTSTWFDVKEIYDSTHGVYHKVAFDAAMVELEKEKKLKYSKHYDKWRLKKI